MTKLILGLHHITAIAENPQKNLDFYSGILGLRLVKKTVNFDAPEVYHLYYGNEKGSPGTILTFFPYVGIAQGKKGRGQLSTTSFSISEGSLVYWMKRLAHFKIPYSAPNKRFSGETFIYFEDHDGLGLELVANSQDHRPSFTYGNIPLEHGIKGFYTATLLLKDYTKTEFILTQLMNHQLIGEENNRRRYAAGSLAEGYLDIEIDPEADIGNGGSGVVHHIAFTTTNTETQQDAREILLEHGLFATPVLDREYFHSIYFREPGGVLFEIATLPPGFSVDEDPAHLGETLKLPPWQEKNRAFIERELPSIQLNLERFKDE